MNKNDNGKQVITRDKKKGQRTFKERDELIDKTVDLILMGFDKPFQIMKMLPVANLNTAKRYMESAEKIIAKIYEQVGDRDRALKKDLAELEMLESQIWDEFQASQKQNNHFKMSINSVTQSIVKVKERRAKLLGLDITNLNLSGNVGLNVAEIARIGEEFRKEQADVGGTGTDLGADGEEHSESNE